MAKFITNDLGFSAFLYFLTPDAFLYAEQPTGSKTVQFIFDDSMPKDGMDCSYLKGIYFGRESVQLRNVKDYANCYKFIARHLTAAKGALGEQVRL